MRERTDWAALTTKGLERATADELGPRHGRWPSLADISVAGPKLVTFSGPSDVFSAGTPRTVDDLLRVYDFNPSFRPAKLSAIADRVRTVVARRHADIGRVAGDGTASCTVSVRGLHKGAGADLVNRVEAVLSEVGLKVQERRRGQLDLRVHFDGDALLVGARFPQGDQPIGRRRWKDGYSRKGALRPTTAAACALSFRSFLEHYWHAPITTLVDPFCGIGTLLFEASLLDNQDSPLSCVGYDVDPEAAEVATEIAQKHFNESNMAFSASGFDSLRLDPGAAVLTNLPWGSQISLTKAASGAWDSRLADLVLHGHPIAALTVEPQRLISFLDNARVSALPMGLLGQQPTLVMACGRS